MYELKELIEWMKETHEWYLEDENDRNDDYDTWYVQACKEILLYIKKNYD